MSKKYLLALLISSNFIIAKENVLLSDEILDQVVCSIPGAKTRRNEEGFLDKLNANLRKEGCLKGDILVIKGSADVGLVTAYVCDIKKDIIVFNSGEVLCTYQGHLSKFRNRIHS